MHVHPCIRFPFQMWSCELLFCMCVCVEMESPGISIFYDLMQYVGWEQWLDLNSPLNLSGLILSLLPPILVVMQVHYDDNPQCVSLQLLLPVNGAHWSLMCFWLLHFICCNSCWQCFQDQNYPCLTGFCEPTTITITVIHLCMSMLQLWYGS